MKKYYMITLLLLSISLMIGVGNAFAYQAGLQFDADGASGSNYQYEVIDTMHLTTYDNYVVVQQTTPGDPQDELSNGDAFYQSYTASVDFTKNDGAVVDNTYSNLFLGIDLNGTITNYDSGSDGTAGSATNPSAVADDTFNVLFTGGSATLYYYDDSNAAVSLATFNAVGGTIYEFIPNADLPVAPVTIQFEFDTISDGAFLSEQGEDLSDLLTEDLLLTVATGSVDLVNVTYDNEKNAFGFELQDNGFTSSFNVVPEPGTVLMFGLGLLCFVGLGRKRV